MGFLKKLVRGIGDVATSVIPGGVDDMIWKQIRPSSGGGSPAPSLPNIPGGNLPAMPGGMKLMPARSAPAAGMVPAPAQGEGLRGFINYLESNARQDVLGTLYGLSTQWPVWLFNMWQDYQAGGSNGFAPPMGGNGSMSNGGGLTGTVEDLIGSNRIVMEPEYKMVVDPPRGYVTVELNGRKVVVLKSVARSLGLWKSRKKPPISASEWGKLKTAARVENKAKKIAQTAGFVCRNKK